jgi:hypothetical protein
MLFRALFCMTLAMTPAGATLAGGGMVITEDACIIEIDFYSAHFTAYQPDTSGNTQFCEDLPDTGTTIFVLDYLHQSLKEVPVDFRIIHNETGQGRFVKFKHVAEIGDIEQVTIFYQPPVVRPDASFKIGFEIAEAGSYIGIVTAGHPTKDTTYTAVFPFEAGRSNSGYLFMQILLVIAAAAYFVYRRRTRKTALSAEVTA